MLAPNTLVEVHWIDAETVSGWTEPDDFPKIKPPSIKTVGYYSHCQKSKGKILWIVVKHSLADSGAGDYTVIPYGCITKLEKID